MLLPSLDRFIADLLMSLDAKLTEFLEASLRDNSVCREGLDILKPGTQTAQARDSIMHCVSA